MTRDTEPTQSPQEGLQNKAVPRVLFYLTKSTLALASHSRGPSSAPNPASLGLLENTDLSSPSCRTFLYTDLLQHLPSVGGSGLSRDKGGLLLGSLLFWYKLKHNPPRETYQVNIPSALLSGQGDYPTKAFCWISLFSSPVLWANMSSTMGSQKDLLMYSTICFLNSDMEGLSRAGDSKAPPIT